MQNINEEYKFLTKNHKGGRLDDGRTVRLSPEHWMLEMDQAQMYITPLTRPAEFRILDFDIMEEELGKITTLEHEFMPALVFGFLIHNRHKEFFMNLEQDDIVLHKAIIIGEREDEEDSIFEGYWLLASPHRPLDWVDIEKSKVYLKSDEIVLGESDSSKIDSLLSVELKESVSDIEQEQRMIFDICSVNGASAHTYLGYPLVHNSIVEYIQANDKTKQLLFLTTEQVHKKPGSLFN